MNKNIKIIVTDKPYHPTDIFMDTKSLYIFGDNLERIGRGGQACIRPCPNALGIATKKSPNEFMHDEEFQKNQMSIDVDIMNIMKAVENVGYTSITFPKSGFGWGRADIQNQCPRTALYLSQRLLETFGFNNLADLVNTKQF